MGVELLEPQVSRPADSRLAIADCDIHPARRSHKDLYPFMEKRWQEHLETFGVRLRQAYQAGPAYPKGQPNAARRDAWPPGGTVPGSDLAFMQQQLLDANNVRLGVLNATADNGQAFQHREFGAAYASAINRWLVAEWTSKEPRLKASIVAPYEDAETAVAEIDAYAGHPDFVQVLMLNRTAEPPGQKRYWPVYEAAARAGLPIGVHAFGFGGWPVTGSGWPSYYIEDMVGHAQSCQAFLSSLVMEGVFERFPQLRVVFIESGFAWVPPLGWRLDPLWARMRGEVPHVKRPPSEYIREHVWFSSQPMEEPEPREHLLDAIEWLGWDKLVFATDYPHWDYDDPARALPLPISDERRRMFLVGNALRLYGQA
jgi:predicted TIM-barrel fold metal-dependent hydrolase